MPSLLPLRSCNPAAVETLLDDAFGAERRTRTAYLLRAGTDYIGALSFGLIAGNRLVGCIQCWPAEILPNAILEDDGEAVPLVLVGPVAVAPANQGEGLGKTLMAAMLDAAMLEGNPPMVMIGDAEYYIRFGFSASETSGWQLPGPYDPKRLLLRNDGDYILPLIGMVGPAKGD